MSYFVTESDSPVDFAGAINYLLANFGAAAAGLIPNEDTGEVTDSNSGEIVGYLYQWMAVRYADNPQGLNFSNSPTNRLYYGIRNSASQTESTNPADYQWTEATGGFGTTKFLYYATTGGRDIQWFVSTELPNELYWERVPTGAINLYRISGSADGVFVDKDLVFITPELNGNWDPTKTAVITFTVVPTNGPSVVVPVTVSTTAQGRLTAVWPSMNDIDVTVIGSNTTELTIRLTAKQGSAESQVYASAAMDTSGAVLSFEFQYLNLRFADSIAPTTVYTEPTGHQFLGLMNSPTTSSSNVPTDYTWYNLGSTLGPMNLLWAHNQGNRLIQFKTGQNNPDPALYTDIYSGSVGTTVDTLDLDNRTGSVIVSGFTTGGNYATTPAVSGSNLSYSLPTLLNFANNADTQEYANVSSVTIDRQGRIKSFTQIDNFAVGVEVFVATAGQTVFTFNHVLGQALVFMNGSLLEPTEYSETTTSITIPNVRTGATITAWRFTSSDATTPTTLYQPFARTTIAATAGTTTYTPTFSGGVTFVGGSELLFVNGVFLEDPYYNYSINGTQIVLGFTPPVGAQLSVVQFRRLNNTLIPFVQGTGVTAQNATLVTTGTQLRNTQFTLATYNGAALVPSIAGVTGEYSTTLGSTVVTLATGAARTNLEVNIEATAFSTQSVATLSSGVGADSAKEMFEGMLLENDKVLVSLGSEDPSKDSVFPVVRFPPTVKEQFAELNERIAALEALIRQQTQGGN